MRVSSTRLVFGLPVACADRVCGEVLGVYLHPATWRITHLVVHERHGHGLARLVPMVLVASIDERIELKCSSAQFERLDFDDEGPRVSGAGDSVAYGGDQMTSLPLLDDKTVSIDRSNSDSTDAFARDLGHTNIPRGQLHVRGDAHIDASDGRVGTLRGLVVDVATATVSHLLVDRGHLLNRREVTVPIAMIEATADSLHATASSRVHLGVPRPGSDREA